jgi:hypothetical protein
MRFPAFGARVSLRTKEFVFVTFYTYGTRNERTKTKEKELINEYHCIHVPPQDSKDSHCKVPSKPLSPEVQHQHFVCSTVVTTVAPKPTIFSLKSQPWI